jgi:hypothetical protein
MGTRAVKRACVAALFGLAATGVAGVASAQTTRDPHDVQPERPTVATHAGTVAPGWVEIETGVEHDRFGPGDNTVFTPTVVKIGLSNTVQLGVFGSAVHTITGSGVGDLAIGAKWRIVDDAPFLGDFAILPTVKFPTGSADRNTGTGTTDASLLLISSHAFGAVSMDVNAGYTRRSGNRANASMSASLWTVSVGGPVRGPAGWTLECYGYPGTGGPAGQAAIVALLGGPTYLVRSWLAVDAGVIVPLAGPQAHALYAGGVYNVGRLWNSPH